MTDYQREMCGRPLQPAFWSSPNESRQQNPRHFDIRNPSPYSQTHHSVQARRSNYPPRHGIDDAVDAPMSGFHRPQYDLAPNGMVASPGSRFVSAPAPIHCQYIDYDHIQHPHDRLNVHLSAPPSHLDPASYKASSTQHAPPRSQMKPEQDTQSLPDNETNLERMRHERESVFQKAASELDQARRITGPSAPTNKAWEDAWDILRESMTKM